MSQQALDVRTSLRMVWRHKVLVGLLATVGLLGGAGYTLRYPPMPTSEALVVLPGSVHNTATQVVIAGSDPVLSHALGSTGDAMTLEKLHHLVQVKSLTSNVISVSAQGKTPRQSQDTANAVAASYVTYVSSASSPIGRVRAHVLERATTATATSLPLRLAETGGIGLLAVGLAGAVIAVTISRNDRRLRERDQMADSVGAPVLASIPVAHPSDASGWVKLLEGYAPANADAWRLRQVLHALGLEPAAADGGSSGSSLAVLTLSSDRKALALGPQLAVYAASVGIPTVLSVGAQHDTKATAGLRAACTAAQASPGRLGNLLVTVSDHTYLPEAPATALTVVVSVVDGSSPHLVDTLNATAAVLGITAGAVTAEQLAHVAASAAADGRPIAGILVADPDSADQTTGRLSRLMWAGRQITPARTNGTARESTR